ncbi:MAG: DUF255 domain-containing protein [Planctomycetota bacterium]
MPPPDAPENQAANRSANELAGETSPYLLQHAHNPVPWRPWGDAAFEEARRRDMPVFLSVGYATCYWCHVMERESFEDEATARLMAEHFVCVKVDREERPDVDEAYMAATQIMTGSGGWPMSVFLEPEGGKPFWCGTYFPRQPAHGRPSFAQVLGGMAAAWKDQRSEVLEQAGTLADAVRRSLGVDAGGAPRIAVGPQAVAKAVQALAQMVDRTNGGFGGAPKFPQPVYLELLLEARQSVDEDTRAAIDTAVVRALDAMALGGIHDHVGGGFHRYAVDATWTVPHFEKMLYDNAQLMAVYARAAAIYDDAHFAHVVARIDRWARREMRLDGGGYASALDAEVDHREGLNYLWTPEQVRDALSDGGDAAIEAYGLDAGPNFRDPHHPEDPPANVLRLEARRNDPADLDAANAALLAVRDARKQPIRDDKVLASWNAMALAGLARAAASLGRTDYLDPASDLAGFLRTRMVASDGLPFRTWRSGVAKQPGFLEDAAYYALGLAELARAQRALDRGDGADSIEHAATVLDAAWRTFGDPDRPGVLYDTRSAELFVRGRSTYDGAVPSAQSALLHAMATLHELDPGGGHAERARLLLASLSGAIAESPVATAGSTAALLRWLRLDPDLARDATAAEAERLEADGPPIDPDFTPVEIYANGDRVTLAPGAPAQIDLVLRIAPGWHIYAADPGGEDLPGLRVGLHRGSGVRVYADYPKGSPWSRDTGVLVHERELEFPVALELEGEWSGRPMLAVRFQACDDSRCLPPRVVELDVAIDRAGASDAQ